MGRSGPSDRPLTVFALPDVHVPIHSRVAVGAVKKWIAARHCDMLLQAGDFFDFELLGRFVDGRPGATEGKRLADDFREGTELWHEIVGASRAVNKKAQSILLQGNHEGRLAAFYDRDPRFRGMFDLPQLMGLADLGTTYVKANDEGDVFRIEWFPDGKVYGVTKTMNDEIVRPGITFTHGWYHGKHSAEKHAQCFGHGDIYFGHVHTEQVYTIETYGKQKRRGVTFGTLGDLDPGYARKAPCTKWVHAFLELTINPARPYHYAMQIHRVIDGVVY